ncbi:signal peptidase II [Gordonia sp. (in: high G+C Gram-positive bacteria)]|uniref:signal peptidase II n=1 Tax=Gordonia sp. (in: high G+C Gram-positive bacteria) TaxID=84139 RepID=UPI00262E76F9|nr:signal peptidase II [Gordonia sp. (in: high G+C Gram-positive bacteria)]
MNDAAPLGAPGTQDDSPPDTGRSRTLLIALAAVAVLVYLADLGTKTLAVRHLDPDEPTRVIGDFFRLTLLRNSGAAFSMATGYTWILTIIALAVVITIIRFSRRLGSAGWAIGLGLILGGALGNLTDRFFREPGPLRGHVVDFLSFGFSWGRWPVFNVADSAVVCGAVLLVALTVLGYDYDGSRSGWAARNDPPADEDLTDEDTNDEGDRDA